MLRFLIVVLVVLWLIGELIVIPFSEREIERRVAERSSDVTGVRADVGTFPVVTKLLLTGRVSRVAVTLDQVVRQRLSFTEVRFDLEGVHADRAAMLQGKVRVTAIEQGTVTATIDLGRLGSVIGRVLEGIGAEVRLDGHTLRVGPASFEISSELFPCEPTATVEGERVFVTCSVNDVPEPLLEALRT